MRYKTPKALEMAVKAAAKSSSMDTGRAIEAFYFHRLLCRVFRGDKPVFVLKGGQAMLARTVDARVTRDIDLLFRETSLDDALENLLDVATVDLGDHMRFVYEGSEPIKVEDEYRSGLKVRFTPWIGPKRLQAVSVDLVVDEIPLSEVDVITPADRVPVADIEDCDYFVYPVENALADKLGAVVERHDGRPSSRVKDLVDMVVYATTCNIDGARLQGCIRREMGARGMDIPPSFSVPPEWVPNHERRFQYLCSQTGIPKRYRTINAAVGLAREVYDPALEGRAAGHVWSHCSLGWASVERS